MPLNAIWPNGHRPKGIKERALMHSIPLTVALWGAYTGIVAMLQGLLDIELTTLIFQIPAPMAIAVGIFQVTGNVTFAAGLLNGEDDISVGWRMERRGIVLAIAGWLSYGATVVITEPKSTIQWTLCLTMSMGLAGRAVSTWRAEKRIRATMAEEDCDGKPTVDDEPTPA